MARTWNATFEAEPDGGDQGSTLDNKQRETRSEIRKRMDTLVSNWDADPDTPTNLDLEDDVVLLAHMSDNSVDSDQYVDGSIDLAHMSAESIDSDQYVDGSIDAAHIASDAVTAAKVLKTFTSGSQVIAQSATWVPAAGIYNVVVGSAYVTLQIYVSGAWRSSDSYSGSGLIYCDGTNMRFNNGSAQVTIYYQKFD